MKRYSLKLGFNPFGLRTVLINETEPSLGAIPDEPLRSLLEFITKSFFLTSFRFSPSSVLATSDNWSTIPDMVTDRGEYETSSTFSDLSVKNLPTRESPQLLGIFPNHSNPVS